MRFRVKYYSYVGLLLLLVVVYRFINLVVLVRAYCSFSTKFYLDSLVLV